MHKNTVQAIVDSLQLIFLQNKYADVIVEKTLKSNPKWGSRDRRFIAENIYDIVRNWRLLINIYNAENEQIISSDYWKIVGIWLKSKNDILPDWEEFEEIKNLNYDEIKAKFIHQPAIIHSFPEWIDQIGKVELGAFWESEMEALNQPAQVVLRVNSLKTNPKELQKMLFNQEIKTDLNSSYSDALVLIKRQNLAQNEYYKNGFFEIQDASSQLVASFLKAEPGMFVIDACAGGGGKSLHLAAIMKNKGKIIAMDTEKWKLDELQKRAKRADVNIIYSETHISPKYFEKYTNKADRLLLDVPCSGLGVIRRNPDTKWKLTPENLCEVKKIQENILKNYSQMLKIGGIMVYATCSILPSENQIQVEKFIFQNPHFQFIEHKIILPSNGFDGFYMAKMKRIS